MFDWTSGGLFRELPPNVDYYGVHWASGGVYSTTTDLARWAELLWGTEEVLTAATREEMTNFLGIEFDFVGLGTFAGCPCWVEGERLRAERWGHLGANGIIEYDPTDRVAMAVHISGSVADLTVLQALDDLTARLRGLIRDRPLR